MRVSLKAKIWITVITIVLMFTVFLLLYVPAQQEKYLLKNYSNEVQNLASTVALGVKIALTEQNFEGVQTAIDFVKDDPRLRFVSLVEVDTVRDEQQKISQVKKTILNSYPQDVKVSVAVKSGDSLVVKRSPFHTPSLNGEILLGFSTTEITKSKEQIRVTSLIVSAIVLIIGIIIGFWLARNISRPVLALRDAALSVGAGDRTQRVRKTTNDEIGELGEAFNKMVEDLFKAEEELKEVNSSLAATNSELKKTLDHLHSAQAQLVQQEKMASLGQLTAGVAHEINNPINFVSANVNPLKRNLNELIDALKKDTVISDDLNFTIEETRQLLNGIEEGSRRTAEIVKGLRNFSRLDEEERKKASINEGILSTLILLQNKLEQQKIEVIHSLKEIPEIECYPGQLNQVFMNLLTNAIDATGSGGTIFITTSYENDQVKISIRDTGHGMSEEVKKKLFDPFFTTKEVGKGTGLGLSISYGIIEKHFGKIEVKSEIGTGTEFIITLPVTGSGEE